MKYQSILIIFSYLILCCCCTSNQEPKAPVSKATVSTKALETNNQKPINNSKINWMSLEAAERASEKEPKNLFVMVYTNWCDNSKKFDQTTYQNPEIIEMLNTDFYAVKLNAHEPNDINFNGKTYANPNYDPARGLNKMNAYHELLFELEAKSVPSTVFLNKDGIVVGSEMGFKDSNQFKALLNNYRTF